MGKLSTILLNSMFLNSAYANSFSVTDCSNDVSTHPGRDPSTIRLGTDPKAQKFVRFLSGQIRDFHIFRLTIGYVPKIPASFITTIPVSFYLNEN